MKILSQFLSKLGYIACSLSVSTIAIASTIIAESATAQSADRVKPLEEINNNQNEQDPLMGNGGFSFFDLIHRSQLSVDSEGFTGTVNRNLDKATEEFLRQREQMLNNRQQVPLTNQTPPTSGTTN